MKQKILSFIFDGKKFLALHSEPHEKHGEGGWFVVTGGVEDNESFEEAVKREVKEETNLDAVELLNLNWGSIYEWWDEVCEEMNFITFVNHGMVKLNEEHNKFEWLNIEEFIKIMKWDDDKNLLKEVLSKAINKKVYFKEKEIKDYRKH